MAAANAFFFLIPAIFALFAVALGIIALADRRLHAARWAVPGFVMAFTAILLDGMREPGSYGWLPWLAVASHFTALIILVQAFLLRHRRHAPLWIVGVAVVAMVLFVPDAPWGPPRWLRVIMVQATGTIILAASLPPLWRQCRKSALDALVFTVMVGATLSYASRSVLFSLNPIGTSPEAMQAVSSDQTVVLLAASGLLGLAAGTVLMMTVGYDMLMVRLRENETDPLTGLGNRRRLDRAVAEDSADKHPICAVIVIDLDHFKQINDSFGHDAGDEVLRAIGATLKDLFAGQGIALRTGGEEFAVLVDAGHGVDCSALALAARKAIAELRFGGAYASLRVTASVGCHQRESGQDIDQAMKLADRAVYCAKTSGRDRVVVALADQDLHILRDVA